jgi:hypothetical protein
MNPFSLEHPVATALFFSTLAVWFAVESRQAIRRRVEATKKDAARPFVQATAVPLNVGG